MKISRLINGLLSLGLVGAIAAGSSYFPNFDLRVGEASSAVAQKVKAKDLSLVCPGAFYRLGGASGTRVNKIERIGEASVAYSADLSSDVELTKSLVNAKSPHAESVQAVDRVTATISSADPLTLSTVDATGKVKQSPKLLTATQLQTIDDSSAAGLLATACTISKAQQWIIGAEAITGRDGILILVNSSKIDSTVALQVYTDAGLVTASGLNGISVPRASAVAIPIATIAPKAPTSAIQITANGGAIAAWVQQKTVRGTVTGGAELIPASVEAAKSLVIPGLTLRGSKQVYRLAKTDEDYFDLVPSIDIFVPGKADATVTVQVLGAGKQKFGTVLNQSVPGGKVMRFVIDGLTDGNYTLFVDSDQPVQAIARASSLNTSPSVTTDFSYLPAVTEAKSSRSVALNSSGTLLIANAGKSTTAEVTNLQTLETKAYSVANLATVAIKLSAGVYAVSSKQPTSATVVLGQGMQLSAVALEPYENLAKKIAVAVR